MLTYKQDPFEELTNIWLSMGFKYKMEYQWLIKQFAKYKVFTQWSSSITSTFMGY